MNRCPQLLLSFLILAAGTFGCANTNSNSSDRARFGPLTLDNSDPRFAGAYQVLSMKCTWCHSHSAWASYTSNELWISSRKVLKNDASNSPIILQIQSGAMPQSGTMSNSETQILIDWINQMP